MKSKITTSVRLVGSGHEFQKNKLIRMSKKLILSAVVTFLFAASALAQTPIIKDFRTVVNDIPNQFDNLKKDLLQDNKEENYKIYSSTIEDLAISRTLITITQSDGPVYIITFKTETMDTMMLRLFTMIAQQYIKEINDMVATGNYKGRDYKSNGEDITELTDNNGVKVLEYISGPKEHLLLFYGAKTR